MSYSRWLIAVLINVVSGLTWTNLLFNGSSVMGLRGHLQNSEVFSDICYYYYTVIFKAATHFSPDWMTNLIQQTVKVTNQPLTCKTDQQGSKGKMLLMCLCA